MNAVNRQKLSPEGSRIILRREVLRRRFFAQFFLHGRKILQLKRVQETRKCSSVEYSSQKIPSLHIRRVEHYLVKMLKVLSDKSFTKAKNVLSERSPSLISFHSNEFQEIHRREIPRQKKSSNKSSQKVFFRTLMKNFMFIWKEI
jgi:hypothetical protein